MPKLRRNYAGVNLSVKQQGGLRNGTVTDDE
jgi:hypothetical protein